MDCCRREGPAQEGCLCESVSTHSCVSAGELCKAVMTAFDSTRAKERKERSQGGFITTITTCGVENEPIVCTILEENSTVTHKIIWSSLVAEFGALAAALVRQLYVSVSLESIFVWRTQRRYWLAITIENPWDHGDRCHITS